MVLLVFQWFAWFVIGSIVGLLGDATRFSRYRRLTSVLIGLLGAFTGGLLSDLVVPVAIIDFNLMSLAGALVGAVVFIVLFRLLRKRHPEIRIRNEADPLDADEGLYRHDAPSGRRRTHRWLLVGLIILLPLLHIALLRVQLPDITVMPPVFGAVETYSGSQGQLAYVVHTPPTYEAGTNLPLLVLLHGCMQTPSILEAASGMTRLADANNFVLVYPQQNGLSSPHRCWNWYAPQHQQRDSGEPALIAGIVRQVRQNYSIDAQRVYLAGISSGGAMTSTLVSCYPGVFAAAAVHSGMAYESATNPLQALVAPLRGSQIPPDVAGRDASACAGAAAQPVPVLVLHGMADTVVFPVNANDTLAQLAQANDYADDGTDNDSVSPEPATSEAGQVPGGYSYRVEQYAADTSAPMTRYLVDGLWHMWSGGTGIPPLSDPKAPDASQIFWTFVSGHRLDG